jgi:hypothetical protein
MSLPIDPPTFAKAVGIGLAGYVAIRKVVAAILPPPEELAMIQELMGAMQGFDPKAFENATESSSS